jgi:hypothetical protein
MDLEIKTNKEICIYCNKEISKKNYFHKKHCSKKKFYIWNTTYAHPSTLDLSSKT